MLSETLKIKPKLDNSSTNDMFKNLNARFSAIAKKFGAGLRLSLKGALTGGLVAAGAMAVNRLLSPIQETEDAIKRTLANADDIVTKSKQFETTAGKMFKLQQVAASSGLEGETLNTMLSKFQVKLAEARTGKDNVLSNYVNEKDTAEAFFKFAQSIQKLPKDQQVLIQQDVFGERLMGKANEFFQTDYQKRLKEIGARPSQEYNTSLQNLGNLEDMQQILEARRNLQDMLNKNKVLKTTQIIGMDETEKLKLQRENTLITQYEATKQADIVAKETQIIVDKGFNGVISGLAELGKSIGSSLWRLEEEQKKVSGSRPMRGINSDSEFNK
jgi:hypothetical protein